jgi:hypothetical protein
MDANFLPHSTPIMQHVQLKATYIPPIAYCLFSNSLNASSENVENVVNPPHTPVFQKRTVLSDTPSRLPVTPTMNHIKIAPNILVISVKTGNSVLTGIRLIAYRATAPKAPPSATNKKLISASLFLFICHDPD